MKSQNVTLKLPADTIRKIKAVAAELGPHATKIVKLVRAVQ